MQFEAKESADNGKTIKVTCTDINDNNCKEEFPKCTNHVPHELLLVLLEEILAMIERCE